MLRREAARNKNQFKNLSVFVTSGEDVIADVGRDQLGQILRASLEVHLFAKKDPRIEDYLFYIFCDKAGPATLVSCGR